ncbi:hypothetical protein [Turicibacter sanguinis]|uniref:hypothetical protein n=1 Tax=Turicibacter sanguinis TaxID=154288 RepID=UPI0018A8BB3E|nr:hypothetical protein [Turicibacter sanguinis]
MNGLEAIELMKQGKMVQNECCIYKLENGEVLFKDKLDVDDEFLKSKSFNFTSNYEEYIEPNPLIGWERVGEREKYYFPNISGVIIHDVNITNTLGEPLYEVANYFSTREKAEEINFKQTLFRKLQRFSDENGGNEIDWKDPNQEKWMIRFDHKMKDLYVGANDYIQNFGQVYFISEKVARNAVGLFHDELIKYFTGDFGGEA